MSGITLFAAKHCKTCDKLRETLSHYYDEIDRLEATISYLEKRVSKLEKRIIKLRGKK